MQNRREILTTLAKATGALILAPRLIACSKPSDVSNPTSTLKEDLPRTLVSGWDPISFNKTRGNQGAIPESYWPSINGADGVLKHLGKHLPYIPQLDQSLIPEGHIALMWGDPSKGYAKHPNAAKGPDNNHQGHWYNWIKIRKAVDGEAEETQSSYSNWPLVEASDNGKYLALDSQTVENDGGRNTIYLAALPSDIVKGDTVRIWAHCLTHGEYVDFMAT